MLPGEHCRLVVQDRNGNWEPSASWVASYEGDATVPAATSVGRANITQLKVVTEQGRTLAALPDRPLSRTGRAAKACRPRTNLTLAQPDEFNHRIHF